MTTQRMHVLLVGGAGYVGSQMGALLADQGAQLTTLDNLCGGHRDAVLHGRFIEGDLADLVLLSQVLVHGQFDAVMHFASFIQVGESVRHPARYYRNIMVNTLMVEQMLEDFDHAYGLKSVSLRYFNAAGADALGRLGERHDPETHLIPLVLQAASGRRPHIQVFGRDYDTPDGTCVRDYVHVEDLCAAHWLALRQLMDGGPSAAFNLGNGTGYSVQEVIDTARAVTGRDIPLMEGARRPGDPARLVADSSQAREHLGWAPRYGALETIISHAWQWERRMAGLGL